MHIKKNYAHCQIEKKEKKVCPILKLVKYSFALTLFIVRAAFVYTD